jgi:hypothetical protein
VIIDCHTHVWESPDQLGRAAGFAVKRLRRTHGNSSNGDPEVTPANHLAACQPVDRTFVLGFKSLYLGADISNRFVADYVGAHPDKMIGFGGIDPTNPGHAIDEIKKISEELGFPGVTIAPSAQDCHPFHSNAIRVYGELAKRNLTLLVHHGIGMSPESKMEYARPYLLDELAREFPDLRIIVAHLGYPWVDEALLLLAKHRNVFADISGLLTLSWKAYNAMLSAHEFGVMDKLLFGSDFPYTSATDSIERLYGLNQLVLGTNLPPIPREQLRSIVERDTLGLLGMAPLARAKSDPHPSLLSDEDQ